jgi:hypothetical protein
MENTYCKRTAWIYCTLQVPLEWDGKQVDWHNAFIKFMNEKGLPEHSASELDLKSVRIVCSNCEKDFLEHQTTVSDDDDTVLCDGCYTEAPEPDDFDEDSDNGGRGER